jgi:D-lactate dehydrogenase (cytochrome)
MMQGINQSEETGREWKEAPSLFIKFAGTKDQMDIDIKKTGG